jgi:hypothetical protein
LAAEEPAKRSVLGGISDTGVRAASAPLAERPAQRVAKKVAAPAAPKLYIPADSELVSGAMQTTSEPIAPAFVLPPTEKGTDLSLCMELTDVLFPATTF